jgi:hypothetical protein
MWKGKGGCAMKDIIVGRVTDIIDLETISVKVTQIVRNLSNQYDSEEQVRFHGFEFHHWNMWNAIPNKRFLGAIPKGKRVMCLVGERDAQGRLEADVYPLDH